MVYLSKRILGVLRDNVNAAVRHAGKAGLWGWGTEWFSEHLVRTRGLDPDKPSTSLQQRRWDAWRTSVQGKGDEAFVGSNNSFWLRGCGLQSQEKGGFLTFGTMLRTQTLPPCGETMVRGRGKDIPQYSMSNNSKTTKVSKKIQIAT